MITADDVRFHTPDNPPFDWAETNYFSVVVPEVNLYAWAYCVARPGVGAIMCDIQVFDVIDDDPMSARYVDIQQHLPLPDKLEEFDLPNGLSLRTSNEPRNYHLTYQGIDDTSFEWNFTGLMEPYDINDPDMDPLASPDPAMTGLGEGYSGHFDMSVAVEGVLTVRGRQFEIDCASVMDHSWGRRSERQMPPMAWINASFGRDKSVNTIWQRNVDEAGEKGYSFRHGYIQTGSDVVGIKSGRLSATRNVRHFPTGYDLVVEDANGNAHSMVGSVAAQLPWSPYSNIVDAHSMVYWYTSDGESGTGASQELLPMDTRTGW